MQNSLANVWQPRTIFFIRTWGGSFKIFSCLRLYPATGIFNENPVTPPPPFPPPATHTRPQRNYSIMILEVIELTKMQQTLHKLFLTRIRKKAINVSLAVGRTIARDRLQNSCRHLGCAILSQTFPLNSLSTCYSSGSGTTFSHILLLCVDPFLVVQGFTLTTSLHRMAS